MIEGVFPGREARSELVGGELVGEGIGGLVGPVPGDGIVVKAVAVVIFIALPGTASFDGLAMR